jgi:hypothetical protein
MQNEIFKMAGRIIFVVAFPPLYRFFKKGKSKRALAEALFYLDQHKYVVIGSNQKLKVDAQGIAEYAFSDNEKILPWTNLVDKFETYNQDGFTCVRCYIIKKAEDHKINENQKKFYEHRIHNVRGWHPLEVKFLLENCYRRFTV